VIVKALPKTFGGYDILLDFKTDGIEETDLHEIIPDLNGVYESASNLRLFDVYK
jgi:hypothetical protein